MFDSAQCLEFVILASVIFGVGICGIFIGKKSLISILISVEVMILGSLINFINFAKLLNDVSGHVYVIFILATAAAESAIGLAIIVVYKHYNKHLYIAKMHNLKG